MTDVTLEVRAREFYQLLSEAVPFAGTDDTLPMLTGICLTSEGNDLIAVATDRYTLGVSRITLSEPVGLFDQRLLPVKSIARIKGIFPVPRGGELFLRLTFTDEGLVIEQAGTLDQALPSTRFSVKWIDAKFPQWRSLLHGKTPVRENPQNVQAGFNPSYMARFARAKQGSEAMVINAPEKVNAPWIVSLGEHFVGLLMPVRIDTVQAAWLPAESAPVAKPVRKPRAKKVAA